LGGFQESADSQHRRRAGLAAVAQIEYEARIADCVPAETGRRSLISIKKFLDFTK
jgi:hypothetical protein